MLDVSAASVVDGAAGRTVELSISGMTCAACAARVEKKLSLIGSGVVAAVSLATEKATITAPEAVPVQALIAAVEGAGYTAQVAGPGGQEGIAATWPVWSGPVPPLAEGFTVRHGAPRSVAPVRLPLPRQVRLRELTARRVNSSGLARGLTLSSGLTPSSVHSRKSMHRTTRKKRL